MSLLRKLRALVFKPGEWRLTMGMPTFRERDEYVATVRAWERLQRAMWEAR